MGDEDRLASWVRKKLNWKEMRSVKTLLRRYGLNTVCESARCPNQSECFGRGQATFLIMGDVCARDCRFCSIKVGIPHPLDETEPLRVADASRFLSLKHVVITSVTRDDLPDGGAEHFFKTVTSVKALEWTPSVEVLTSDLGGSVYALDRIIESHPDVYNHNVETVPSLYPKIRPRADYERSLMILDRAARSDRRIRIKSGLMVGFGERMEEVRAVLHDLKDAGCHTVTIGQYLRPTLRNVPVKEYVSMDSFKAFEEYGKKLGLETIASPLARSSYRADHYAVLLS
ncbi:MAG: lipoyl synthase [Acidobacteriota bacterium]